MTRGNIKRNHQRKETNFPIASSSSSPLVDCIRFGIINVESRSDGFSFNSCGDLVVIDDSLLIIESGLGGAGISGTGIGVNDVILRNGVGGGIKGAFFGGSGGVVEICRSNTTRDSERLLFEFSSFDCCELSAREGFDSLVKEGDAACNGAFSSKLFNS